MKDKDRSRRDSRAPDGIFSEGYRLVRPGGRIKAVDNWYQHDALIPHVGSTIFVMMNDYWYSEIICITDDLDRNQICKAKRLIGGKNEFQ